jgi:hypothetical protein
VSLTWGTLYKKAGEEGKIRMIVGMKYLDKPTYTRILTKKAKNATCNTKYF